MVLRILPLPRRLWDCGLEPGRPSFRETVLFLLYNRSSSHPDRVGRALQGVVKAPRKGGSPTSLAN